MPWMPPGNDDSLYQEIEDAGLALAEDVKEAIQWESLSDRASRAISALVEVAHYAILEPNDHQARLATRDWVINALLIDHRNEHSDRTRADRLRESLEGQPLELSDWVKADLAAYPAAEA